MIETGFVHLFKKSEEGLDNAPTLLLLHGTGGNENDLVGLSRAFGDQWNLLGPRGKVLEDGMHRYFRRLAPGVFDQQDLKARTEELAAFVQQAAAFYGFNPSRVVALGYSNGANIAASLLLSGYQTFRHAILMHPMLPFIPKEFPDLKKSRILITAGENDPVVALSNVEELRDILQESKARVEVFHHSSGHDITPAEIEKAASFGNSLKKFL